MKTILKFAISLLVFSFTENVYGQPGKGAKPNIILLVADDLNYNDIAPYGSKQVRTPHIEKLAAQGVCFDNMFTSTAMCSPSRQQLLTGLYPVRNGAYPNHSYVYPGTKSIAHYLKDLGYHTAIIGKRDFGNAASFPFQFLGGRNGDNGKGPDINLGDAEKYIRQSRQPYFLVVGLNEPHVPLTRGNADLYPPEKIQLPAGFVSNDITQKTLSRYFAEISYLDSLVGVCLNMVEQSDQKDNTIIIFTSEQGGQFPFAKWTCYDQGLKTAFIIKWPGKIKPASRNNVLTQYVDIVPTLIDIAGGDPSAVNTGNKDARGNTSLDGKSFLPALKDQSKEIRSYVYGVHTTRGIIKGSESYPIRSVRNKQYLYIRNLNYQQDFHNILTGSPLFASWLHSKSRADQQRAEAYVHRPEEELYDVVNDPSQLVNLAAKKEFDPVKKEMRRQLEKFMKQQGDEGLVTERKALERQPAQSGGTEE